MKTHDEIKKGLEACGSDECHGHHTDCPYEDDFFCTMHICGDARAYIQQLENQIGELTEKVSQLEAAIPKWINVKDRLPEVPKNYNWIEVLCLWKIPEINYVSYRVMRYYGEHNALSFPTGWSLHGDPLDRVTDWSIAMSHWMPLPEPPKDDT